MRKLSFLMALTFLLTAGCTQERESVPETVPANGDEPYIFVHTEFPSGVTYEPSVDITYDAKPSKGAEIRAVRYISNGVPYKAIYRADNAEIGELYKARVPLFIGENNITFEVEDSNGKKARFDIANKPIGEFDWDIPEPGIMKDSEKCGSIKYTENRILVSVKDKDVPRKSVEKAVKSIDGEIIGKAGTIYFIQVADSTEQELLALCEKLMCKYSDMLVYALLDQAYAVTDSVPPTNDPWWNDTGNEEITP